MRRVLLCALVAFSIGSVFFTPLERVMAQTKAVLPWLGIGLVVTETMFIAGLTLMGAALGLEVRNPLRLRKSIKKILGAAVQTRAFWVGFWVNAVGACATALLLGTAVVLVLPATSWGLVYFAALDLAATIAIRHWALNACRSQGSDGSMPKRRCGSAPTLGSGRAV